MLLKTSSAPLLFNLWSQLLNAYAQPLNVGAHVLVSDGPLYNLDCQLLNVGAQFFIIYVLEMSAFIGTIDICMIGQWNT